MRADEPALMVSIALVKNYQSIGTFIIEGNDARQFGIGFVAARTKKSKEPGLSRWWRFASAHCPDDAG
jgi:hypothetical protein